jgi:hypothetical protein
MSKSSPTDVLRDTLIDERFGECQSCRVERVLSSGGYCEACLMLAHAAKTDEAAMIALKLRATWR